MREKIEVESEKFNIREVTVLIHIQHSAFIKWWKNNVLNIQISPFTNLMLGFPKQLKNKSCLYTMINDHNTLFTLLDKWFLIYYIHFIVTINIFITQKYY